MIDPAETLLELITSHGLECATEDEWVLPYGELPAIRASWYPQETLGRLSIDVLVEAGVLINESFAGLGEGEKGLADAWANFMRNSLHVFLSAFWDQTDEEQVQRADITVAGQTHRLYLGNIGVRTSAGVEVSPPPMLFDLIQRTLEQQTSASRVTACRVLYVNVKGEPTYEALLNNQPWPQALEALQQAQWPETEGFYSFRHFALCIAQ